MEQVNMVSIAHLKCDYETWENLFLSHEDNQEQVNNGNFLYGKANDNTAIIIMKNVDMAAMAERASDPEFKKMVEPYIEYHEFFTLNEMKPPQ
ncbi:MAG: hypothetical protein QGI44_02530 [Candidatus Marinimicrobia bacterium]|jgi:hypothetical protein|nr:hypothetical protein [Candidatus Neomarinimicrobiota bacterium]MDP7437298.1 hypothetical protein [Candidatus Neomarinimicrobiota bacterium]|tara:strand:+ start:105 stop:383 length:279 start_codon:yes stop_codon:yes gene_type:complete